MIDTLYQADTDKALDDQAARPIVPPKPPPNAFRFGDLAAAPFQGIGSGVAKTLAFGSEMLGAFGDVLGAAPDAMGVQMTDEQKQQANAARQKLLTVGPGFSNDVGDAFRQRARDIMPDPQTTHVSAQVVAGLTDFMTQAVGYTATAGPLVGSALLAGDVGMAESDRLKQQGVDLATRTKAGALAGVVAGGSVAVPMTGASALIRAAKGVAVGEGSIVGQSLGEKTILKNAGYDKIGDTFDPLDPVSLGLGLVPGVLGASLGHAAPRVAAALPPGAKALGDMGLGERQALKYNDVRLDAYAVQAAQQQGIPPEILLAVKNAGEKSGSTATSPKGAQGVMQFMPSTFKEFGRGDATDPINSIDAGAAYLKKLHDTYGDWDAALAHYNGGGAQAAIVRGGGRPTIPETAKYLDRIHDYLGQAQDDRVAAAVQTNPDLVPAARVNLAAQALDASRLTPEADLPGRDAHVQAVETAADQMARGEPVNVSDIVGPAIEEAPPADGSVRLYRDASDPAQFTPEPPAGDAPRLSVDLPQEHPALAAATTDETGRASVRLPADIASTAAPPAPRVIQGDRLQQTAGAVDQLRAAREPVEPPAPKAEPAERPATEAPGRPPPAPKGGSDATGKPEALAQAHIDRAAAEVSLLNPDMLVHMDGMDAPMRVGDLLDRVKAEAADDASEAHLVQVAAECALRH